MSFKKRQPGCPCCLTCERSFTTYTDFTSADASAPNSNYWEQISGTWTSRSPLLGVTCDTDGGILLYNGTDSEAVSQRARQTLGPSDHRMIFNYLDIDNYSFAEVDVTASTVRFATVVSGSETTISTASISIGTAIQAGYCKSYIQAIGGVGPSNFAEANVGDTGGRRWGYGVKTSGDFVDNVEVGNFILRGGNLGYGRQAYTVDDGGTLLNVYETGYPYDALAEFRNGFPSLKITPGSGDSTSVTYTTSGGKAYSATLDCPDLTALSGEILIAADSTTVTVTAIPAP